MKKIDLDILIFVYFYVGVLQDEKVKRFCFVFLISLDER